MSNSTIIKLVRLLRQCIFGQLLCTWEIVMWPVMCAGLWYDVMWCVQGCQQDLASLVDESCDAANRSLSSLCELTGKLSVCLGVVMPDSTHLNQVTTTTQSLTLIDILLNDAISHNICIHSSLVEFTGITTIASFHVLCDLHIITSMEQNRLQGWHLPL